MFSDRLASDLYREICRIPLIDPHSHIDPLAAASKHLDDILGYHYYTELAHSAGMSQAPLAADVPKNDRVREILGYLNRIDNTVQYSWFLDIAREFLGFQGDRIDAADADRLIAAADHVFSQTDWESQVFKKSNLEKIFLTNDFDDPLEGFDTVKYVPCLRTDDLVFHLDKSEVRNRLAKATGIEVADRKTLSLAIRKLFDHFTSRGARACAISLPPYFTPSPLFHPGDFDVLLSDSALSRKMHDDAHAQMANGVFICLAEHCREYRLPFDLMIGVNRGVYRGGVHQGRDLFDQRTSLIQYQELFNAFPEVTFPISVLTSSQNQELVSYAWIFPNVVASGHWWYSNIPAYAAHDARARLQAVPKTKQLGYYSDAYKLEFVLPKFNMYRRILAKILADDFVRPGVYNEHQAIALARALLRENTQRIFNV